VTIEGNQVTIGAEVKREIRAGRRASSCCAVSAVSAASTAASRCRSSWTKRERGEIRERGAGAHPGQEGGGGRPETRDPVTRAARTARGRPARGGKAAVGRRLPARVAGVPAARGQRRRFAGYSSSMLSRKKLHGEDAVAIRRNVLRRHPRVLERPDVSLDHQHAPPIVVAGGPQIPAGQFLISSSHRPAGSPGPRGPGRRRPVFPPGKRRSTGTRRPCPNTSNTAPTARCGPRYALARRRVYGRGLLRHHVRLAPFERPRPCRRARAAARRPSRAAPSGRWCSGRRMRRRSGRGVTRSPPGISSRASPHRAITRRSPPSWQRRCPRGLLFFRCWETICRRQAPRRRQPPQPPPGAPRRRGPCRCIMSMGIRSLRRVKWVRRAARCHAACAPLTGRPPARRPYRGRRSKRLASLYDSTSTCRPDRIFALHRLPPFGRSRSAWWYMKHSRVAASVSRKVANSSERCPSVPPRTTVVGHVVPAGRRLGDPAEAAVGQVVDLVVVVEHDPAEAGDAEVLEQQIAGEDVDGGQLPQRDCRTRASRASAARRRALEVDVSGIIRRSMYRCLTTTWLPSISMTDGATASSSAMSPGRSARAGTRRRSTPRMSVIRRRGRGA